MALGYVVPVYVVGLVDVVALVVVFVVDSVVEVEKFGD